MVSENGHAVELSYDHKPNVPSERQRVNQAGLHVQDDRVSGVIAVSRAIGDWEYKKQSLPQEKMALTALPDIKVRPITKDTEFIICACDGIWDCMNNQ